MIISYRGICFPQSAKTAIGLRLPKVTVSDLCLLAIVRLLNTLRQPTTRFALLIWTHQVGAVPEFRQPYDLLEPDLDCFREIHSFANQLGQDHACSFALSRRCIIVSSPVDYNLRRIVCVYRPVTQSDIGATGQSRRSP
ncbi:hypothetical protein T265_10086 [Opisthorchis viverrini]|uniref:Uncharacterized protein n=1 Tax=Opisthorchis viverrini TaxID=6198 RepID=A0A074Z7U4_OPIVI|nr:hypothetical protein T265_10086 [Opisthorchis viverrini]KER21642.1 hypothetical protein T265_10086 [Opisthorchis viverrini]